METNLLVDSATCRVEVTYSCFRSARDFLPPYKSACPSRNTIFSRQRVSRSRSAGTQVNVHAALNEERAEKGARLAETLEAGLVQGRWSPSAGRTDRGTAGTVVAHERDRGRRRNPPRAALLFGGLAPCTAIVSCVAASPCEPTTRK